jgi:hypothetical protein
MMQKINIDFTALGGIVCVMVNDANIYIKLRDAVKVAAGYPLRGSLEALPSGDVYLVQLKNMDLDSDVEWESVNCVSLPSRRTPNWLTEEDVIFAARGTKTLAYPLSNVPEKTVCAPQFFVLSANGNVQLSPRFLAWQLNQKPAQDYLHRNATGDHIRNIRRGVLEDLTIAVPPIDKQMSIVAFWQAAQKERSLLNSLIENRNSQLEALATGLVRDGKEARI